MLWNTGSLFCISSIASLNSRLPSLADTTVGVRAWWWRVREYGLWRGLLTCARTRRRGRNQELVHGRKQGRASRAIRVNASREVRRPQQRRPRCTRGSSRYDGHCRAIRFRDSCNALRGRHLRARLVLCTAMQGNRSDVVVPVSSQQKNTQWQQQGACLNSNLRSSPLGDIHIGAGSA